MIARYEGRVEDDIPVCESLKNRYQNCVFTRKDGETFTPNYMKAMRYEILMNCDLDFVPPVFIHTLQSGIGGRTRSYINERIA